MDQIKVFTYEVHQDERGYLGIPFDVKQKEIQDLHFHPIQLNTGYSRLKNTFHGFHYQVASHSQAKLVYCLKGEILSFGVDIRKDSPDFGKGYQALLSEENHQVMYLPKGFAHGYINLRDDTLMAWLVDAPFDRESARCLSYLNPELLPLLDGVDLKTMIVSEKDKLEDFDS